MHWCAFLFGGSWQFSVLMPEWSGPFLNGLGGPHRCFGQRFDSAQLHSPFGAAMVSTGHKEGDWSLLGKSKSRNCEQHRTFLPSSSPCCCLTLLREMGWSQPYHPSDSWGWNAPLKPLDYLDIWWLSICHYVLARKLVEHRRWGCFNPFPFITRER